MLAGFSRLEATKRTRNLGTTSSVKAKLWALKDGLNLGQQLGINNINVEMDIEVLVYMFMNPHLLTLCWNPSYLTAGAVQLIDFLISFSKKKKKDFLILNEPPPVVEPLVAFDKARLFCNKHVCC